MIALDTSSVVAYLAGEDAPDTDAVDRAIHHRAAVLPPVVLAELLSATNLDDEVRTTLVELPLLEVLDGYWVRTGLLCRRLHAHGLKARLADALISQSCLDHRVGLITRDRDFRNFVRHGGLVLAAAP